MFPGGQPQNVQLHGGQLPVVQYPGMYYNAVNPVAAPAWQSQSNSKADDGRDLLAQSYERMRNEMRSLQGGAKPDAPPPPSMDSSRDNTAIKMLLNNENVSLSSLLEAAMDPSAGSNKGTEDPIMKKTVLDKCEGKIAQLYRHRISGMGTFFPTVPPKGTKANSSCFLTFHHPRIEFNMKRIDAVWHCPEVNVEAGQVKQTAKAVVEGDSVKPKRAKSPALKAAEVYANKPNPLVSPNLVGYSESKSEKPSSPSGRIPVIGPSSAIGLHPVVASHPVVDPHQKVQTIDLTRPPPITTSHPEPPSDPYATTAFELWAEIERERRHKEKLQEWDMLNEKHKERDREKEERKRKKKRHRHHRSRSRSRSRNRRRSRSYSRSRSRHGERRYRSRSRRRTRSISLSPSPSRKRPTSPLIIRRFSRSPPRRSPPRRSPSPRPLSIPPSMYSNEPVSRFQPGPPGGEWPTSSAWPSSTSYGPPTSEFYDPYGGRQVYPEGGDNYYGNDGTYPPYNMPPDYYGIRAPFPPRGYHQMNGPPRWMPPSYRYRPPLNVVAPPSSRVERSKTVTKRTTAKSKSATPSQNLVDVPAAAAVKGQRNDSAGQNLKPESNIKVTSSKVHPPQKPSGEVIILDDDDVTREKNGPKPFSTSVDHPPGVSPDRELPQLPIRLPSEKESEFTKPLRAKFKELLKPFEKILDTLKSRQRDSYEYKTLIKGLEIGTCEFDGVYTLVEGILCRVVIDSKEGAKTCFKIVLSPTHVTPILMEIHRVYHDYTAYKIQEAIDDLFYDVKLFPSWKIINVIKVCKICKSEDETQRKKKEEMQQKSPERHESNDVDKESRSKSKSHRRRSASKGRDDRKKSRRGSKDDRDRQEKTSSHSSKKSEELNDATQKSGDVSVNVITESFKKESPKQTSAGGKKITDLSGDKLRTIESVSSDAPGSKTVEKNVVKAKNPSSELGVNTVGKSARSNTNRSKSPDASTGKKNAQPKKGSKMDGASEKDDANDGSSPLNRDSESLKPEGQLVDPVTPRKPLVPYGIGKNNKPEDFKVRVRKAQLSVDDLKTVIASLEGPAKHDVDTSYLLKAGMLCKRVPAPAEQKNDGKSEVKIAVTPESLLKMIQIVHTMAAAHAPIEKTIAVFNKHFTPIKGVQEAVLIVLNNCEVCKSL